MEQMALAMQDHTGGMTDDNTKRKDCTLPGTSSYILLRDEQIGYFQFGKKVSKIEERYWCDNNIYISKFLEA